MESYDDMDKVLEELKRRLETLNHKMEDEVLVECNKRKKIYKEIIDLAGELNDFFTE
jgi:hypothetical protein